MQNEDNNKGRNEEMNKLEHDPRRFFAMVKSEVKDLDQEESLLNLTRYDLMQATLEQEIASYRENSIKWRAKSYGFAFEILVILLFLALIVLFLYLDIKVISIIFAVALLAFLIVANVSGMRKNSMQEKIGFVLLNKFKNLDEISFKDGELVSELENLKEKRSKLRNDFSSIIEKSEYLKFIPEEFLNLYSINSLYKIARAKEAETITDTYNKLREQLEREEDL